MPENKKKSTTPDETSDIKVALNKELNEVISRKKVVYTEIDDEVTEIFDKIKKIPSKHVYVVIPTRSIIFQSVVNLKILKRKAADNDKVIYFITNDKNGVYLAAQVGISVYNKADDGGPSLFSAQVDDDKLRITPLRASVNAAQEEAPTRLTEKKISISEILRRKNGMKTVDVSKIDRPTVNKKEKPKFVVVAPSRHALIGLTVLSIFILFIIVYIALPGATIYLTPAASVLEKSVNITLADYQNNKSELDTRPTHMIASYPIEMNSEKTITHFSTGKKISERGANSSGKITIINTQPNIWPLIAETRFQTEDGLVYRIKGPVTVPAANSSGYGKLEAFVTADPTDSYGALVGERGNIDPTKFFLPGLKEDSRSKIYAESSEPMTGGITDFVSFISPEDIEAARARINDELLKDAVEQLRIAVSDKTKLVEGATVYTLLEGEGAIKVGDVTANVPTNLQGQELKEFSVSGSVFVTGVYYDHDQMLEIMKSELMLKKSPQKELLRINEDSTSYRIFEWNEAQGKIKLTANIKGIEQYEIDPDKENGERLLKKIQDHIAGKDIDTAKTFIQNLPEINKVEIDSWPAWAPTIPSITENIDFEVRDALNVS